MPDIPNRDELERILARKLGGLSRRQMGKLLELMGDPPSLDNVPMSFWDDAGKEMAQVVTPFSERVYLEGAERMLETVPVGVDWSLVNESASQWARQYSYNLVSGINATTQRAVGQAVGNFYSQAWTMGDLRRKLGNIYGPVRADMIAQTEVTRAAAEGERGVVAEIGKEGIRMVEVWQTSNDEIVCPICGPRHGKKQGDGWTRNDGPPAHPRCRCWINHEFEKPTRDGLPQDFQSLSQAEEYLDNKGVVYGHDLQRIAEIEADQYEAIYGWDASHTREGFIRNKLSQYEGLELTEKQKLDALRGVSEAIEGGYSPGDVPVLLRKGIERYEGGVYDPSLRTITLYEPKGKFTQELITERLANADAIYPSNYSGVYVHEYGHHYSITQHPEVTERARGVFADLTTEKRKFIRREISIYASTDPIELAAESYTLRQHPDYIKLGSDVKDFISDLLGY
jgi:hypothetical protein